MPTDAANFGGQTATSHQSVPIGHPGDLSVTVIIPDFNYGHFLPACLDSLRQQTRSPDEIIVINDGSTDASAQILAREDGITVIEQENLGQAATFNAGFRASAGDVVIFLDADDRLKPQAIEIICRLWSDDVSCLCYDLELIDRDGTPAGRYEMRVPDIDLRSRLLRDLAMPFMPTSGNAFRRKAIEWAFPLPEKRWKLAADAVLIRAAVFGAPIRHLPHTLGEYRIHRHNNWYREVAASDWRLQRGHADIARAGLEVARLAPKSPNGLSPAELLLLLFAAIKSQLKADELSSQPGGISTLLREVSQLWPPGNRRQVSALFLVLRLFLPRNAMLKSLIIERPSRPSLIESAKVWIVGRRLIRDMQAAVSARAPYDRLRRVGNVHRTPLDAHFDDPAWCRHWTGDYFDLCGGAGEIRFARAGSEPVELILDLEPTRGTIAQVAVSKNKVSLARFDLAARGGIPIQLSATRSVAAEDMRIEISVTAKNINGRGWFGRLAAPCERIRTYGFYIGSAVAEQTGAVVPVSVDMAFAKIEGSALTSKKVKEMSGFESSEDLDALILATPPLQPPYCLSLQVGASQPDGWLTLSIGADSLFSGRLGPSACIVAELSEAMIPAIGAVEIAYGFRPDDFTENDVVIFERIGWLPGPAKNKSGTRLLHRNAWIGPTFPGSAREFLVGDWSFSEFEEPIFYASTAGLKFSLEPIVAREPYELSIDLGPARPSIERSEIVLVVSVNGVQKAALRLEGRDIIHVSLELDQFDKASEIDLGLHAMITSDGGPPRPHGGIVLHGFGFSQLGNAMSRRTLLPEPAHPCFRLAELPGDNLFAMQNTELLTLRDTLRYEISLLAARALEDFLTPDALRQLMTLGLLSPVADGASSVNPDWSKNDGPAEWFRWLALTMLDGPGWLMAQDCGLDEIPEFDVDFAGTIGSWMMSPIIAARSDEVAEQYAQVAARRLGEARAIIASYNTAGSRFATAEACLRAFDLTATLSGTQLHKSAITAFGAALEARLLRDGRDILPPWTPTDTPITGSLRIGLVVRTADDLAPGRSICRLAAELSSLGTVTSFSIDEGLNMRAPEKEGLPCVNLAGLSLSSAVASVRNADLDIVLLAGRFFTADAYAEIAAHHLAPRQYALYPAQAAGLASVDAVISGAEFCGENANPDPSAITVDGLGFLPDIVETPHHPEAERSLVRARLGIREDADVVLVLVSGSLTGSSVAGLVSSLMARTGEKTVIVLATLLLNLPNDQISHGFTRLAIPATENERFRLIAPVDWDEFSRAVCCADFLLSLGSSAEDAVHSILVAGMQSIALASSPLENQRLKTSLSTLGLGESAAESADDAIDKMANLLDGSTSVEGMVLPPEGAIGQPDFTRWLTDFFISSNGGMLSAPRYLFHHMPKTGGTSLRNMFADWFDITTDYREWWGTEEPEPIGLSSIPPGGMLFGHFGTDRMPLCDRYPETQDTTKWRKVTFVRDPLERALSWYAFEYVERPKHDPDFQPQTLSEFLRNCPSHFLEHFECNTNNWREALDSYWFIGTTERFDECVAYLGQEFGKPHLESLTYHRTQTKFRPEPDDIQQFVKRLSVEFEMYREIAFRLARRLGEPPLDSALR